MKKIKFSSIGKVDIFYFAIFCLLFLSLFQNFFFRANTFYERDTTLLEIPLRKHAAELLKQGHFALWTEAHGNGQPFMANPKTAIFYPTTWLYLILPFFVAFKIHYFIHPLIGWLGMYLLAGTYGLSKKASFLSSSLFFLSGLYLSSFEFYNHIAAIAWMMWALYLHRLNPPVKSSKFLLSVFAWILLILSGAPEFIIITGILAFAQCFFAPDKFKLSFFRLIIVIFFACLVSAVQLLPALDLLSQTERTSQAEIWPLELIQLFNLVFPGILGDDRTPGHNDFWGGHLFHRWYPLYYSFYIGFGAFLFFIHSLFSLKKRKTKILALTAFIFFLISCGKYSPFFYIYTHIPVISSIRYPVKYVVGTFFCLSLMAGFSFDRLLLQSVSRVFARILFLISSFCFLLFILFKSSILSWLCNLFVIDDLTSKKYLFISLLTGLGLFFFYSILFFLIGHLNWKKHLWVTILIFACLIDLAFHNRHINPTVPISFFNKPLILDEITSQAKIYRDETLPFFMGLEKIEKKKIFSYYWETLFPFIGMTFGIQYLFNRDFMNSYPLFQRELRKKFESLTKKEKLKILNYLGCQYYLGTKPYFNPASAKKISLGKFNFYLEEITNEHPKPFLVFDYIQINSLEKQLETFLDSDFDPKQVAIINVNLEPSRQTKFEDRAINLPKRKNKESIEVVQEKHGFGKYKVCLEKPGLAVFLGNWAKGWRAYVDGQRTKVFSINLFSRGTYLGSGQHEIVLKYLPPSFLAGSIISLLSFLLLIALWLIKKI